VSSISFAVSKQFEKHSMDVKHLAETGEVFTSDKDKNILLNIDILKLIQTEGKTLKADATTENLVELLSETKQQLFPVLDEKNVLVGIIDLDAIRPIIFNSFRVKFTPLKEIITSPATVISYDDGMETVMEKFEISQKEQLPVLKGGRYFGVISKVELLEAYREKLQEMIIE
jgi:chloride channel protein, CIC family